MLIKQLQRDARYLQALNFFYVESVKYQRLRVMFLNIKAKPQ